MADSQGFFEAKVYDINGQPYYGGKLLRFAFPCTCKKADGSIVCPDWSEATKRVGLHPADYTLITV
jgi:hypothetical protein